jgi:hypothetical protein
MMQTVTWPYGSLKTVVVEQIVPFKGTNILICTECDTREKAGHVIAGGDHAIDPTVRMKAVMEFTRGGPTGGYWRLIREEL